MRDYTFITIIYIYIRLNIFYIIVSNENDMQEDLDLSSNPAWLNFSMGGE